MASFVRLLTKCPRLQNRSFLGNLLSQVHVLNSEHSLVKRYYSSDQFWESKPKSTQKLLESFHDSSSLFFLLDKEKAKGAMQSVTSLRLLKITRGILRIEPKDKHKEILDRVLSDMSSLGVKFTLEHFKVLLVIRHTSGEKMSPADVFTDIYKRGFIPDEELCDTLIGICTDIGDIEGAVTVLTHAKEANLPLTPSMLSTMMQGYILNGDKRGFEEVLATMKNLNIYLDPKGYTKLITVNAKMGYLDIVSNLMQKFHDKFNVKMGAVLSIYACLVRSGHSDYAAEFLVSWSNNNVSQIPLGPEMQACTTLLVDGFAEEAFNGLMYCLKGYDVPLVPAKMFIMYCVRSNQPPKYIDEKVMVLKRDCDIDITTSDIIRMASWFKNTSTLMYLYPTATEQNQRLIFKHLSDVLFTEEIPGTYSKLSVLSDEQSVDPKISTLAVLALMCKGESFTDIASQFREMRIPVTFSTLSEVLEEVRFSTLEFVVSRYGINQHTIDASLHLLKRHCDKGFSSSARKLLDLIESSGLDLSDCSEYKALAQRLEEDNLFFSESLILTDKIDLLTAGQEGSGIGKLLPSSTETPKSGGQKETTAQTQEMYAKYDKENLEQSEKTKNTNQLVSDHMMVGEALKTKDIKQINMVLAKLPTTEKMLTEEDVTQIAELSQNKEILQRLTWVLHKTGDIENLVVLLKCVSLSCQNDVASNFVKTCLKKQRGNEVVTLLESRPDFLNCVTNVVNLQLMARQDPSTFDKVVNLILNSEEERSLPLQKLVQHFLCCKEYDTLQKKFADHVQKLNPAFILRGLQPNLYNTEDRPISPIFYLSSEHMETASLEIMKLVRPENRSKLPDIYNHLMLLKMSEDDMPAAIKYYEHCLNEGFSLSDIRHKTLKKMEETLLKNGQNVPWTKAAMHVRNKPWVELNVEEDSSSSDESSSEEEESQMSQHSTVQPTECKT